MFSTEHRQNSLQLTELKLPPRCTKPKEKALIVFDRDGNTKSFLAVRFGARSLYQSEIEFSRSFKPLESKDKSGKILHRISNLLLTQKNVVVTSPENVVMENVVNVVDPSENVVVQKNVAENVVGGGVKRHWAALQAFHISVNERPRREAWPFLARLYNEARTYFQSQI